MGHSQSTAKALLADDLASYKAAEDGSHLRLGITVIGMVRFLRCIGYLQPGESFGRYDVLYNCDVACTRKPETKRWLDVHVGALETVEKGTWGRMPKHITGYDLLDFVNGWINDNGHTEHSVCEIILLDERFEAFRDTVGPASVFWSHIQRESFAESIQTGSGSRPTISNLRAACNLFCWTNPFFWLDYFCLRQLQQDFHLERIRTLIEDLDFFCSICRREPPLHQTLLLLV